MRRLGLLGVLGAGCAWLALAAVSPASPRPRLSSVAQLVCPAARLCVGIAPEAGDGTVISPNLVTSRAPRAGAAGWAAQTVDGGRPLKALACASLQFCLIVDHQNRVLVSSDPARGAAGWKLAPGGPGRHLDNVQMVSCPSAHLCVGLAGHYVVSSVRPVRGGAAWRQALVNSDWEFAADCPSTTRCVAAGDDGKVLTTNDPTGRTAWRAARLIPALLSPSTGPVGSQSVSCASATQCVVAFGGEVFASSDVGAPRATWQETTLVASHLPRGYAPPLDVSCTTAGVCAAASPTTVWASPAPGPSGRRHWKRVAFDPGVPAGHGLTSIACIAVSSAWPPMPTAMS